MFEIVVVETFVIVALLWALVRAWSREAPAQAPLLQRVREEAGRTTVVPSGARPPGLVHIAGAYDPLDGQCCIVCGLVFWAPLDCYQVQEGSGGLHPWAEGGLIYTDGFLSMDVTDNENAATYERCSAE